MTSATARLTRLYSGNIVADGIFPEEAWICTTPEVALLARLTGFREAAMQATVQKLVDWGAVPTVGDALFSLRVEAEVEVEVEVGPSALDAREIAYAVAGRTIWVSDSGPSLVARAVEATYLALDGARKLSAVSKVYEPFIPVTPSAPITCPDCKGARIYVGGGYYPAEPCRLCNGAGVVTV